MHANVTSDRGGGSGGGSWRLPADETLQVSDPKEKIDVRNETRSICCTLYRFKCLHLCTNTSCTTHKRHTQCNLSIVFDVQNVLCELINSVHNSQWEN